MGRRRKPNLDNNENDIIHLRFISSEPFIAARSGMLFVHRTNTLPQSQRGFFVSIERRRDRSMSALRGKAGHQCLSLRTSVPALIKLMGIPRRGECSDSILFDHESRRSKDTTVPTSSYCKLNRISAFLQKSGAKFTIAGA